MTTVVSRPRMIVEGAFHTNADTGDRLWNDITSYVDFEESTLSVAQRRTTIFDERSPGTLTFTVDNDDGEFTDTNDGSPFYPGITNNTPLRARIQYPTTDNLLPGAVSRADDVNFWLPEQGQIDTDDGTLVTPVEGTDSNIVWSTGVLEQTNVRIMVGNNPWSEPSDIPIYVTQGEAYSVAVQLQADGTISCSLRLSWYDQSGTFISEETSDVVSLTSDWQTLSIENAIAPEDGSLRIAVANETTVLPSTRAIAYSGGTDITKQWVKECTFEIPDSASAGDYAMAWVRLSNKNSDINIPDGWDKVNNWPDDRGRTVLLEKVLGPQDPGTNVKITLSPGNVHYNRWYVSCITYTQVDQSSPVNQHAASTESSVTTNHVTPSVTTTVDGCYIVSAVFDVSTTNQSWGAPESETVRQYGYCIKGNACTGIITDTGAAEDSGTYGTKTFTATKKSKYCTKHTVALTPASGTGPDNVDVYIGAPILVNDSSVPDYVAAGDWENLITAYADEWAPYWQMDHALVSVSATDRSKLLDPINVGSAVQESIEQLGPIAYYILNESGSGAEDDPTTAADSTANSNPPLTPVKIGDGTGVSGEDPLEWGQGKSAGVDGDAALIVNCKDYANGYYLLAEHLNTPLGGGEGCSVVFFWKSSASDSSEEITMAKFSPVTKSITTRTEIEFYGKPGNYFGVKSRVASDGTSFYCEAQVSDDYFDNTTRCIGATLEMTGGQAVLTLYADGDVIATDTEATAITDIKTMNAVAVGDAYPNYTRLCLGTYSNLAFFNSVLSSDDMSNISEAGLTSFSGDLVTDRMYRILDWTNQTGTNFDDSTIVCDRHMPDETALLDALQLVAATDGGTVYIDGSDNIAFKSSATKQNEFDPVLTVSAGDLSQQPSATQNDDLLVNDVTVNRLGAGNSQVLTSPASIAQYGDHAKSIDTLCYTDQDAAAICGYYLAFYASPITRFDTISVEMLAQDDWTDFFAATEMWKIIRITDLPNTAPSDILDSHSEGVQWDISATSWLLTWDVSYAIPFAVVDDSVRGIMGNVVVGR